MPGPDQNQIPVDAVSKPIYQKPRNIPAGSMDAVALTTMVCLRMRDLGHEAFTTDNIWVDEMIAEGKLLDGEGNPLPADYERDNQSRSRLVGEKLLNGESLYVYGEGELYPREMRLNPQTREVEFGDVTAQPPKTPANPFADREFQRRRRVYDKVHAPEQENRVITNSTKLQNRLTAQENALHEAEKRQENFEIVFGKPKPKPAEVTKPEEKAPVKEEIKPENKTEKSEKEEVKSEEKLPELTVGEPTVQQTTRAAMLTSYLRGKLPKLGDEEEKRIADHLADLSTKALAARASIESAEPGKPMNMEKAMTDLLTFETIRHGIESGDPKLLENLATADGFMATELKLQENREFQDTVKNVHTPAEMKNALDDPVGKSTLQSILDATVGKAAEVEKKQEPVQEKTVQKQSLKEVPPLYDGPKYAPPKDRTVDGNDRAALVESMNQMIRDDLGYTREGKDLGKSRMLDYLAETGRLMDGNGNPMQGDIGRTDEQRAKEFGKRLQSGESFFVYGRGELYPREIRYDRETGVLECSRPLDRRPEKPGPDVPSQVMKDYQRRAFAYEHFSHGPNQEKVVQNDPELRELEKQRKEIQAENAKIEAQNADLAPKKQVKRPSKPEYDPTKPIPDTEKYDGAPKDIEEMTDRLAVAVGRSMGYEEEFAKVGGGTQPLELLANGGTILDESGNLLESPPEDSKQGRAKVYGARLARGESLYVCRKGETYPREVSYDKATNSIKIGEKLDQPPEEVQKPSGWARFWNPLTRNEDVAAYNRYLKKKQAYEKFSAKEFQENRMRYDPYLKEKSNKAFGEKEKKSGWSQQVKQEIEQEAARYGDDFDARVQKRVEDMAADYELNHSDRPITAMGMENLRKLCSNYEKAKIDLASGNIKGKNGAQTVRDIMAYELAQKGINDPEATRLLGDVNNPYYSKNMAEVAKTTSDYKYMTNRSRDNTTAFLQDQLGNPEKAEEISKNAYRRSIPMAKRVDQQYFENRKILQENPAYTGNKPVYGPDTGIPNKNALDPKLVEDYGKQALQQNSPKLKSAKELASHFKQFEQPKSQNPMQR